MFRGDYFFLTERILRLSRPGNKNYTSSIIVNTIKHTLPPTRYLLPIFDLRFTRLVVATSAESNTFITQHT